LLLGGRLVFLFLFVPCASFPPFNTTQYQSHTIMGKKNRRTYAGADHFSGLHNISGAQP
jgi:hypothetical protein